MRKLALVLVLGCGSRSDLSPVPGSDASTPLADASIDVAPLGSFVLSVTPTKSTVVQGGPSLQLAVHVTRLPPFTGEVDVDLPALPTGISATKATFAPGVTDATVTLSASLQSDQGDATLDVRGTSAATTEHVPIDVFVRGCPGCLDTTFGAKGRVYVSDIPYLMALDASDRIVLGEETSKSNEGVVARFDANGAVDVTFGTNGSTSLAYSMENMNALSVAANGRIVLAGGRQTTSASLFGIAARFTSSGALDPSFGQSGIVVVSTPPWSSFGPIVQLSDGSFVSGGWAWTSSSENSANIWLSKLLPSGAADASFGTGGATKATWSTGLNVDGYTHVARAGDQFIVAATTNDVLSLARFNGDGSVDTTFGVGGQVATAATLYVFGDELFVTSDGKLFASGVDTSEWKSELARFNADGALDTTFGNGGVIKTNPISAPGTSARGAAPDPDGKVVVLGEGEDTSDDTTAYLLRVNSDGSFDATFGTAGVTKISFGPSTQPRCGPAIQSDGRIVVAFDVYDPTSKTATQLLARYWN